MDDKSRTMQRIFGPDMTIHQGYIKSIYIRFLQDTNITSQTHSTMHSGVTLPEPLQIPMELLLDPHIVLY